MTHSTVLLIANIAFDLGMSMKARGVTVYETHPTVDNFIAELVDLIVVGLDPQLKQINAGDVPRNTKGHEINLIDMIDAFTHVLFPLQVNALCEVDIDIIQCLVQSHLNRIGS